MAHSTKDVRLCSLGGMGGSGDWGMWVGETAQERDLTHIIQCAVKRRCTGREGRLIRKARLWVRGWLRTG